MTEFSREQKKELLMQELELTHEVEDLKDEIKGYAETFQELSQHLVFLIQDGCANDLQISYFDLEKAKDLDIVKMIEKTSALAKKRKELEDTTRLLSYIRQRKQ